MTDMSSIMDKIRILRSSRRNANQGKAKDIPQPSITMSSVTKTKPQSSITMSSVTKTKPQPSITMSSVTKTKVDPSQSSQQWVPVLVLDVSQTQSSAECDAKALTLTQAKSVSDNSLTDMPSLEAVPVSDNFVESSKEFPATTTAGSKRTVIKTRMRKGHYSPMKNNIPVACTIMVSSKDFKKTRKSSGSPTKGSTKTTSKVSKSVRDAGSSPKKPEVALAVKPPAFKQCDNEINTPVIPTTSASENTSEPQKTSDSKLTGSLAPVGCVICSKTFPTLSEMQAHYLSEHKNRRGRDRSKRAAEGVSVETPKNCNVTSHKDKGSPDNADFKLPYYVSESDPKCPVCSIAFKSSLEVKNHVKLVHSYRCSECNDTFYTLFEFTSHKCNKGVKKLRKVKRKLNRGASVTQEVAKALKSFVPIQPNVKKKPKEITLDDSSDTPTVTPVPSKVSEMSVLSVSGVASNEVRINGKTQLEITSANEINESESLFSKARTPSPKLTISPLDNAPTPRKIRILETKNLHGFKFKKDEAVEEPTVTKSEVIQEKLAQLKSNPNVSVSWIPKLKVQMEDESEYVCGRCNVICDDMDDYMDHIQDCLTITSVTLERTSHPPQRILRLQKEVSSFGFQENNNNRYSINKNLMKKLQEVLPDIEPEPFSHEDETPQFEENDLSEQLTTSDICQGHMNGVSESTRSEEFESSIGSSIHIKEEPPDDFMFCDDVAIRNGTNVLAAKGTQKGFQPTSAGISKVVQPMVMIPVDQTHARFDNLVSKSQASKVSSPVSSSPSSPWDSSPLDLLIDTEDIKMEVEEEVIDDNYKDL